EVVADVLTVVPPAMPPPPNLPLGAADTRTIVDWVGSGGPAAAPDDCRPDGGPPDAGGQDAGGHDGGSMDAAMHDADVGDAALDGAPVDASMDAMPAIDAGPP